MPRTDAHLSHIASPAGAGRTAPDDPLDWARIAWLLDRLDPQVGEPGGVPGEILIPPAHRALAEAA